MTFQFIFAGSFAFILSLVLTFFATKKFPKWGLLDRPQKYGLSRKAIPYYGGLILFIVFVISVLLFVKFNTLLVVFLISATLITAISFADDLYGISPFPRLFVQILCGAILFFGGISINVISNPFGEALNLQLLRDPFAGVAILSLIATVLWVVMIVNTMNFIDGLNGLPSGVAVIASLTIFFLSIRPGIHYDISTQIPVAMMSIILFGTVLAFWFFDFYPAKILMGDTGSMFLGFVLATLAIFSGGKLATAFLVLGFPILDAIWVIVRRLVQGKNPMKGDLKHFHHRLLESGLSERRALFVIYALCAVFGFIAVVFVGVQKVYALGFLFVAMGFAGFLSVYGKRRG